MRTAYLRRLIRNNSPALPWVFSLYKTLKPDQRDLEIVSLQWMDQAASGHQGMLRPGGGSVSHGPRYANGERQQQVRINVPDICYRVFSNARVSVVSSSVVLDDHTVVVERVRNGDHQQYDYAGGHIVMHGSKKAIIRLDEALPIEKGIFLGGNGSLNYYHWLIEIVPKCEFIASLPGAYGDFPILVNEAVKANPSYREILAMFAPGREVVYLDPAQSYVVEDLVCIDTPNNLPINLVDGVACRAVHSFVSEASIDYLRRVALAHAARVTRGGAWGNRLFLGRKNERRPYNQREVEKILARYDFAQVFMEDCSFAEQVCLIRDAEWIVGPTGAAWANLIFGQAGVKCLCWMAEELGEFSAFSNIAATVGADLRYLTYRAGTRSTRDLYRASYEIDIGEIDRLLSESCA